MHHYLHRSCSWEIRQDRGKFEILSLLCPQALLHVWRITLVFPGSMSVSLYCIRPSFVQKKNCDWAGAVFGASADAAIHERCSAQGRTVFWVSVYSHSLQTIRFISTHLSRPWIFVLLRHSHLNKHERCSFAWSNITSSRPYDGPSSRLQVHIAAYQDASLRKTQTTGGPQINSDQCTETARHSFRGKYLSQVAYHST